MFRIINYFNIIIMEVIGVLFAVIGLLIFYYLIKSLFFSSGTSKLERDIETIEFFSDELKNFNIKEDNERIINIIKEIESKNSSSDFLKSHHNIDKFFYKFCFHPNVYNSIMSPQDDIKSLVAITLLRSRFGELSFSLSLFTSFLNKELNLDFILKGNLLINNSNNTTHAFPEYHLTYGVDDENYLVILGFDINNLNIVNENGFLSLARTFIINVENGLPENIFVLVQNPLGFVFREVFENGASGIVLNPSINIEDENNSINYQPLIQYLENKVIVKTDDVIQNDFSILIFQFIYDFLYKELINKKDNTCDLITGVSLDLEKALFFELFIKFFNNNNVNAYYDLENGLIILPELNEDFFIWTYDYEEWEFNSKMYQIIINNKKPDHIDNTAPIIHSLIVLLDDDNIVQSIFVVEFPLIRDNPILKSLNEKGHDLIDVRYLMGEVSIEEYNIMGYESEFADALIHTHYREF